MTKIIEVFIVVMLIIIALSMYNTHNNTEAKSKVMIMKLAEKTYAEGQRDAVNGDVRLDLLKNCWKKSPWDENEPVGDIGMCGK